MSIRTLVLAAALLAPLCAAAESPGDCHQAAFVGPIELAAVGSPSVLPLAAVGEVMLADGTRVADGDPVPAGRALHHGVVRNVGEVPVAVGVVGGETVHLAPKGTIAVTTAAGLPNERICVCACKCGSDDVQIRCDTLDTDCSKLNPRNGNLVPCVNDQGRDDTLTGCRRIFVKPGTGTTNPSASPEAG